MQAHFPLSSVVATTDSHFAVTAMAYIPALWHLTLGIGNMLQLYLEIVIGIS